MDFDDLEFTIMNDDNQSVICKIISLIPNGEDESYVVFTDNSVDENDNIILKYGRLVKIEDEYELMAGIDPNELEYIKDKFHEDLIEIANSIMENN